jgi:hypothetical protein
MIPIAIRTRNRAVYLDTTLKSLWATDLPEDCPIVVIDDLSDGDVMTKYLFTDDVIELPEPHKWHDGPAWQQRAGKIENVPRLRGIKSRVEVVQPGMRQGVRGGIFWCTNYMMTRFPDAPAVIVIEADAIFHKDWYTATMKAYEGSKVGKGPNGERLGLLSAYDRKGLNKNTNPRGWGWRSVRQLGNGNWNCGNGIGGVMYLLTREFYQADIKCMSKDRPYHPGQRGGDTTLQGHCAFQKFNIAVTSPSFIQHIGWVSSAWPGKNWRHTRNFKQPFAFEEFRANGFAYSKDWE